MLFSLCLILLSSVFASGQEPPVYVNNLSVEAGLAMEKIAAKNPSNLKTDAELTEWARARLAWVALKRLQGREKEALTIFEGCGETCEKYGPEREWQATRDWACPGENKGQKKREATVCLSKSKAQRPSR